MAPSPAPPGQCCVFLFSTSLVERGTTLIRVGEGGVSLKRTFWTSFLCKQGMCRCQCALLATVSTNFVADCCYKQNFSEALTRNKLKAGNQKVTLRTVPTNSKVFLRVTEYAENADLNKCY